MEEHFLVCCVNSAPAVRRYTEYQERAGERLSRNAPGRSRSGCSVVTQVNVSTVPRSSESSEAKTTSTNYSTLGTLSLRMSYVAEEWIGILQAEVRSETRMGCT
jgi:hypothetical protein